MSRAEGAIAWSPSREWSGPDHGRIDLWRIALEGSPIAPSPLSSDERRRVERLLSPDRRRQYANARAALRVVLARYLDRDPAALVLEVGRHGKPELPTSGLSFNLTHSGDLALLAVTPSTLPLGIDVEECDAGRPIDRLAERFFSAVEAERYASLPATERVAAFYRLWARKEAYLKAWGTGLTFSSRRFTIALAPGCGRWLERTEMPGGEDLAAWWFDDVDAAPGFAAAVCWPGARRPLRGYEFA